MTTPDSAACARCKGRGELPDTIIGKSPCTDCRGSGSAAVAALPDSEVHATAAPCPSCGPYSDHCPGCAAVSRVRQLLADQEAYCGDERLDVPSWVTSVRKALNDE